MKEHHYHSKVVWTGNTGAGTADYRSYERSHHIIIENKALIEGSSDPAFRGDKSRHNPEDLLLSSLSSCHMLWYLHFCSVNNVIVEAYTDCAEGIMVEEEDGRGRFTSVTLRPDVLVKSASMADLALALHQKAGEYCFIANSVNFPVGHLPRIRVSAQ